MRFLKFQVFTSNKERYINYSGSISNCSSGVLMSKIGHTKNKILDLVSSGNKTASDISKELGLSLNTVIQHMDELKDMGAVEEVRSEHFRKWKSYKLNQNFNYNSISITKDTEMIFLKKGKTLLVIMLIAVVLIFAIYSNATSKTASSRQIDVALTDPPSVPPGTDALYINYSSVFIDILSNGTLERIESHDSGSVNLMSLVNFSEKIARFNIPANSIVEGVGLRINSENIVINNQTYKVVLRQGEIVSPIFGDKNSSDEILVDLAPTVIPMYINGVEVFVMVSQVGSVLLNSNSAQNQVGNVSRLDGTALVELGLISTNLSLTNPSLSVQNDSINLSLSVKNIGNRGIILRSLILLGNETLLNSIGPYVPSALGLITKNHMGVELITNNNGTLQLARSNYLNASLERIDQTYPSAVSGYMLMPNQSIKLKYSGELDTPNNSSIELVDGTTYRIGIMADFVNKATVNVTAT